MEWKRTHKGRGVTMSTKQKRKLKKKGDLVRIWSPLVLEEVYNKLIIDANRATKEDRSKEANRIMKKANIIKERMQRILNLIEKGLLKENG